MTIMSTFSKYDVTPLSKDGKIHKKITDYLSEWTIKDLIVIPLSTLDRPPFVNFVHALNPGYQKPCRKTFTSVILPQLYAETKGHLLTEFVKVSVTWNNTTDGGNTKFYGKWIYVFFKLATCQTTIKPIFLSFFFFFFFFFYYWYYYAGSYIFFFFFFSQQNSFLFTLFAQI